MSCQNYRPNSYPVAILISLTVGIVFGQLIIAPLSGVSTEVVDRSAAPNSVNLADLPAAELEQLAANVLSTLTEKTKLADKDATGKSDSIRQPLNPEQIRLGIRNAGRLLPLAKRLTLESLRERVKTSALTKEARLIAGVKHLVVDRTMGDSAAVNDGDLSKIWIGPDYATNLTLDDEAVVLLGHELTHVAARTGGLNDFIENVTATAQPSAGILFSQEQKEELACDFTAAEVLKRFIALHPTSELSSKRFLLPFGYETQAERLKRAWTGFCESYRGDSRDAEHLGRDQTIRSLTVLDEDLKAFVPSDALEIRFCH